MKQHYSALQWFWLKYSPHELVGQRCKWQIVLHLHSTFNVYLLRKALVPFTNSRIGGSVASTTSTNRIGKHSLIHSHNNCLCGEFEVHYLAQEYLNMLTTGESILHEPSHLIENQEKRRTSKKNKENHLLSVFPMSKKLYLLLKLASMTVSKGEWNR